MARVTVEDCVLKVPNRFELVMMASNRAKHLEKGSQITVDRDNDKNTVVALREIADGTIELDKLKEALVTDLQKLKNVEEKVPEVEELRVIDMAADDDLMSISDDEESLSNAGFSEATDDNLDDEQ